jgi:arylsulfatase A-like enzyme
MTHAARHPNVLFFFTDDQRSDTIRALGNRDVHTPTLDAIAAEGTAFRNAYIMGGSCGAVCMPSRAMLMPGRTLFHIDRQGQDVPAEHVLMGEAFQRAGYHTFGTGKWHNGRSAYARSFTHGRRVFFGGMSQHFAVPLNRFDPAGKYPRERVYYEKGKHSSDLFTGAATDFLEGRADDDTPFFAYVSFTAPHDPRDTHVKYHAMYDPAGVPLPANYLPEHPFDNGELRIRDELLAPFPRPPECIQRHLADYYAMITHADAAIGRVLDTLRRIGKYENTLLVFAGDNGLAVGRHGLMGKQNLYEHSVHVPLMLAGPGVPRGETRDAFCYLLDIFPTLCDLAGIETPHTVEGASLAPAMADPTAAARDTLLFAYKGVHRAARDERWKLIEYVVDGRRSTQLFDLRADPLEMNDLAGDASCAAHVRRLRKELRRWRDELGDTQEGLGEAFWSGYDAVE